MLVIGTLLYLPLLYAFFELPKMIINGALQPGAEMFPITIFGISMSQVGYLVFLCFTLLGLMLVTAGMRYVLSVQKGVLGEVMLRRLRYDLFTQVLKFPLLHFRRVSAGEVVTMATAEAEPLGRYMGVAVANPVLQGGTLITAMTFLFVQDWILGLAAISLFPVQAFLVPKLQKRMNEQSRRRLANVRLFAGHVSESISGVREIHSHDTSVFERARASHRLGILFRIRRTLYKLGNGIIFLNTFFTQLTPFLFYLIGGYLVIMGDLTLGALVAVIAAYRETVQPWNELLENYQQLEDNRVKYAAMIENFLPAGQRELPDCEETTGHAGSLEGELEVANVTLMDGETRLLDDVSLKATVPGKFAIVGPVGSGKSELAQVLCGLLQPSSGVVRISGRNLETLSPEEIGHCIGYVDQDSHVFTGSWRENLLYGLHHRPVEEFERAPEDFEEREIWVREAMAAGNTAVDLDADWVDYSSLGLEDRAGLDRRLAEVNRLVGLETDLMSMGIRALPEVQRYPALSSGLLTARDDLRQRLEHAGLSDEVEVFNEDSFTQNATVGENFLYGRPTDETFDVYHIGDNDFVLGVLKEHDLLDGLVEVGRQTALEIVEMFQDVSGGDERLDRLSLIPAEEMHTFQAILVRIERGGLATLTPAERTKLLSLVFAQSPAHQRFGLLDEEMCQRIVAARKTFRATLPDRLRDCVEFFDESAVCNGITVQCNVLFGRVARSQQRAQVDTMIREVIEAAGVSDEVMALGLDSTVGTAGSRLSPAQRQKLALARCLAKKPSILIVNEAINALDREEQDQILERILDYVDGHGLVWIDREGAELGEFEQVITMRAGRVTKSERQGFADVLAGEEAQGGETIEDVMHILLDTPLLEGVSSNTAKILAYAGDQQRYSAGEILLRQGDHGADCFFILEGLVDVSVGDGSERKVVAELGPGEVIGETALLLDMPRSATVTARTDILILRLSRNLFTDLLRRDENFGIAIMRTLARRLVETTSATKAAPDEALAGED